MAKASELIDIKDVFEYLKHNLKITLIDQTRGPNYEVPASLGIRVLLYLRNPTTGKEEQISSDYVTVG